MDMGMQSLTLWSVIAGSGHDQGSRKTWDMLDISKD